jgi:hypothetical protein
MDVKELATLIDLYTRIVARDANDDLTGFMRKVIINELESRIERHEDENRRLKDELDYIWKKCHPEPIITFHSGSIVTRFLNWVTGTR